MNLPPSATSVSPAVDSREKERFALLLDINHELLHESIQIQTTQQELKKEYAAAGGNPAERKPTEEENFFQQDYLQYVTASQPALTLLSSAPRREFTDWDNWDSCMRRLQANLSYMAALADRKPDVKVPPCPAYLSPPPLNLSLRLRAQPIGAEGLDGVVDTVADRAERDRIIKELYRHLQALFPGFDPRKEPAFGRFAAGPKAGAAGAQGPAQASPTVQQGPSMPSLPTANPGTM